MPRSEGHLSIVAVEGHLHAEFHLHVVCRLSIPKSSWYTASPPKKSASTRVSSGANLRSLRQEEREWICLVEVAEPVTEALRVQRARRAPPEGGLHRGLSHASGRPRRLTPSPLSTGRLPLTLPASSRPSGRSARRWTHRRSSGLWSRGGRR
jgi:hypothetical protein